MPARLAFPSDEVAILGRAVEPTNWRLTPEAAPAIPTLGLVIAQENTAARQPSAISRRRAFTATATRDRPSPELIHAPSVWYGFTTLAATSGHSILSGTTPYSSARRPSPARRFTCCGSTVRECSIPVRPSWRKANLCRRTDEAMQNKTGHGATCGVRSPRANLVDRRRFLTRVAALGGYCHLTEKDVRTARA